MPDDTGAGGKGGKTDEEAALSARLRRLGEQLDGAAARRPPENGPRARSTADASALARALRLSAELVGGVIVGAAIGWVIDFGLGTSPWGFIVFLLLGFTAGVFNVIRAAGVTGSGGDAGGRRDR
jgi:ATP synthase protein I